MRARVYAAGLGLMFAVAAWAADPDSPFSTDKKQFEKQFRTIALTPIDADGYFDLPERAAAILEQEVTARLEKRGYKVIPSSVLAGIRQTMEQQVGGFTNSETGEIDEARVQAVRTHSFRELWFQQKFDALGNIRVSIYQVPLENDMVEWDGTRQEIAHEGRGKKYTAKVYVSSVAVAFYDASFRQHYLNYGGIEPLMYRADEKLEVLDNSKLFRDEKKIREAVKLAVDPL